MQANMQTDKQAPQFCQKCQEAAVVLEKSDMEIETSSCCKICAGRNMGKQQKDYINLPKLYRTSPKHDINPRSPIHY